MAMEDFDELDVEDRQFPTIRHLHLKDPVILQPQPAVSFTHSQVSILRIRLKAIDGWMVGKVNVDNNPGISMKFGIRNIPALLYFNKGEIVDKQIGAVPKSVLAGKLDKQLA